jgi:hypothetical protein
VSISLDNALWFAAMFAQAVLVGVVFYRRIWRTLPIFCSFCVWDLVSNVGAYVVNRLYPASYFHFYFGQAIIDSALQFAVLVELGWSLLRPLRSSLPRAALLAIIALILLAGAAIWPFAALPGLEHVGRQAHLLVQLQQTVAVLRILLFLLLAGGSQFLSISWRDHELQIATGWGVVSLVILTAAVLHTHQTTASQYQHLGQIVVASYLCCLVYLVVCFAQKEAERREFTPQMQKVLLAMAGSARTARVALSESRGDKVHPQIKR